MFRINFILFLLLTLYGSIEAQQRLYPVRGGEAWGMIDSTGELIVDYGYESISEFGKSGYAIAQKNGLLGVLDTVGNTVIPFTYEWMDYIGEGLFAIKKDQVWQVINSKEEVVLDSMSGKVNFLGNGYLSYEEISGVGLAHIENGKLLAPKYASFRFLTPQFVVAYGQNYEQYLFSNKGEQILPSVYKSIKVNGAFIWARELDKWGAYDLNGNIIIEHNWKSYMALGNTFYSLTNNKGQVSLYSTVASETVMTKQDYFMAFDDNYAQFFDHDRNRGLVDVFGNVVFKGQYASIANFGDSTFRVKSEDNFGIITYGGEIIAPVAYDYIGGLSKDVALVRKGKKYGIINFKGEQVLPVIYSESLNLKDNVARYKDTSNVLKMFVFDESGQIKSGTKYSNLKSLKIRTSGRNTAANQASIRPPNISNPNQISDSLAWRYHPGSRKWGLWNLNTKKYKFYPQWDNVQVLRDLGLTIVGNAKNEIGGRITTGRVSLKLHRVYGLFTNTHGLPISKMEFLDIRLSDFQTLGLDVARCIFVGGKHGILARSGKILSGGYTYIGEFVEGRARATKKGRLLVDLDKKIKRPIMPANKYFVDFRAAFSFDNDDDPKFYDAFRSFGGLYCSEGKWGYLDTFGQLNSAYKYDYVEDYSNGRALVQKGGKWGMVDEEGNEVLEPVYDDFDFLPKAEKKLFFVAKHIRLFGMIDSNAKVIVPANYTRIRDYKEDRVAIQNTSGWGFMDKDKNIVVKPQYRIARDFSEGLSIIYKKSKWGAIGIDGNVKIEPSFIRMGNFKEGKAWVYLAKGKKGYVDKNGTLLFSGKYSRVTDFTDSIARVYVRKKGWGLIDAKGDYIMKPKRKFKKIGSFNEYGLAKVKIRKKYRLINKKGEFVGKKAFGLIRDFKEGYAVVREDVLSGFRLGKPNLNFGFIDTTGELVTKEDYRQLQDFNEGRAAFTGDKSKKGYINYKGEVVLEPRYLKVEPFENNRAVVWLTYNKTGVIDTAGNEIVPIEINKVVGIKENLILIRKNSWTYYFIHEDMKRHSPLNFNNAHLFENHMAPIKVGQKWGVVNEKGIKTLIPKYAEIKPFKEGVAKVTVQNLYGVVDVKGNVIIEPEYEYVSYAGEGLFRVEKGNKIGYLNMDGKWIWEMQ